MILVALNTELVIDAEATAGATALTAHLEGDITSVTSGDELYVTFGGDALTDTFEVIRVTSASGGSATVDRAVSGTAQVLPAATRLPARASGEVLDATHWPAPVDAAPKEAAGGKSSVPVITASSRHVQNSFHALDVYRDPVLPPVSYDGHLILVGSAAEELF